MSKHQPDLENEQQDIPDRCTNDNVLSFPCCNEDQQPKLLQIHLATKSQRELRRLYRGEYNSFRAMRERCRDEKALLDTSLDTFPKFLCVLGKKPSTKATVDRIDNDRREYAADNVRWADARTQANNRSTTIILTGGDGTRLPLAEWARETGQKADTLRHRRRRGWSDTEIITGTRVNSGPTTKVSTLPREVHDPHEFEKKFKRWRKHHQMHPGATRAAFLCAVTHHRGLAHALVLSQRYPDEFGESANPYATPSSELVSDDRYLKWQNCQRLYTNFYPDVEAYEPAKLLLRKVRSDLTFLGWLGPL